MSSFVLSKAPASIMKIETSRKQARKSEGGGQAVNHDKQLPLHVDVSHERFTEALEWLMPGADRFAKDMSGQDTSYTQKVSNTKKLGKVCVVIRDGEGQSIILEIQNAELRGANTLTLGKRGQSRHMPLRLIGAVAGAALPKLDDYLRADVLVDVKVQQMDIEEEIKKSGKGTKKTPYLLRDRNDVEPEQQDAFAKD